MSRAQHNLRVGVLGVGRIGRLHAGNIANETVGARLVAVSDARSDLAGEVAEQMGVPSIDADRLIEDPNVDAVAICSSTDSHVDLIVKAAAAGKAIFCEKPISLDLTQVDHALDAVAKNKVAFMIGFNRRFDPSHDAVHEAVRRGDIGDTHLVRITSRDPAPPPIDYIKVSGGIFLDMTIHDFDMARFVTGSEVVEVFAQGAVRIDSAIGDAGDLDTVVVTLRHVNGCFSQIDNSRRAVYGYDQRVEVFGANGMVGSDNVPETTTMIRSADGARSAALQNFFLERYRDSYLREWRAFVVAWKTGSPPPVGGADGRAALVIGLAAKRSIDLGRPVAITEIN